MQILDEHIIKKSALNFLKGYYKFRERESETKLAIDMQSGDGIIVDGYLSFKLDDDGNEFSVALEATSKESADEVKYQLLDTDISWDGATFSTLTTAFIIAYIYEFQYQLFNSWGLYGSLCFVVILLSLFLLLYYLTFKGLSRYHYIYALEQFKQYDAEEQWIALGENVFDSPFDPYLVELKKQCIYSGFGLLIVNENLDIQMLITPGREGVLTKRRKKKTFVTQNVEAASIKKKKKNKLKSYWASYLDFSDYNLNSLMRYRKNHLPQIFLSSMGVLIISTVFYKELRDGKFTYVDEDGHVQRMMKLEDRPETRHYEVKDKPIKPFKDEAVNYLGEYPDGLIKEEKKENYDWKGLDHIPDGGVEAILTQGDGSHVVYDCSRLFNIEGKNYLVQDGRYFNLKYAKKRISYLNQHGINANCIWMSCFSQKDDSYLVFTNLIYQNSADASEVLDEFNSKMSTLNLIQAQPKITILKR